MVRLEAEEVSVAPVLKEIQDNQVLRDLWEREEEQDLKDREEPLVSLVCLVYLGRMEYLVGLENVVRPVNLVHKDYQEHLE